MKTITPYFAGLLIFSALAAAAQNKETRAVGDFTQIKASGATTLYLTQGPRAAVVVEAPAEIQPYIKVETRDGKLYVYHESGGLTATVRSWFSNNEKHGAKIYVTCPRLTALELSGATDVNGRTPFAADDFTIAASGASDVRLELTAKTLTVRASGASDVLPERRSREPTGARQRQQRLPRRQAAQPASHRRGQRQQRTPTYRPSGWSRTPAGPATCIIRSREVGRASAGGFWARGVAQVEAGE